VLRGERSLSIDTFADLSRQAPGTPMKTDWYPRIVTSTQFVWLSSKARHPNAGTLFIDWLLSDPGQRVIAAGGRSPVLEIDTPVSIAKLVPANATFTPVADLQDFYENTSTYIDLYKSLFGG
jgi:iron(III) transport system substrate-binding protein